jgi:hypothetical protein
VKRLICKIIGHTFDPMDSYSCYCCRCHMEWHPWQSDFRAARRSGWNFLIWWMRFKAGWRRIWATRTCEVCNKPLTLHQYFICDRPECYDSWIPF